MMNAADRKWFQGWWRAYGLPRDLIATFGGQQWVANAIEYAAARAFARGLARGRQRGFADARVTFDNLRCAQHLVDDAGQEYVVARVTRLRDEAVTTCRLGIDGRSTVVEWTRAEFKERHWRRVR
jgi:hypothetical protein